VRRSTQAGVKRINRRVLGPNMKRRMGRVRKLLLRALVVVVGALGVTAPASALLLGLLGNGIGQVTINGNTVVAQVDLLGIVGTELRLEFESVQNLSAQNLGLGARLVSPLDPNLLARLPAEGLGALSVALPVAISVDPPANGGLKFQNTVRAEIHTHTLGFTIDSPLRLYKSPHDGEFFDMTSAVAPGSVRTRGSTGGFSDFIVVLDLLPSAQHAEDKYDYLVTRSADPAIPVAVRAMLAHDLAASRAEFDADNYAGAQQQLALFVQHVRANAGGAIPNEWRSQRDRDNVAGDLLGYAGSLSFSIDRASRE
jgi:hypothetical protein